MLNLKLIEYNFVDKLILYFKAKVMKQLLLSVCLFSIGSFAQTVTVLNVSANELAYSSYNGKIYATLPSINGSNGNSIGIINPNTLTVESTVPIGSEPTVIAISNDGQTLYCGFSGTSTVRKFDVTTNTASTQFPLGSDSFLGPFYAEDLEVMPNNSNTIAVARRNVGYSPKHEGVGIYDNGIVRPTTSQDHTGSNQIEFVDAGQLVGFNNETTEFGFRRLTITAAGVSETSVVNSIVSGFGLKFSTYGNKAFFSNGAVVDFNFAPYVAGTFSGVSGPGVYDTYTNLVAYGSYDLNGVLAFKRYNPDSYLLTTNLPITQATGDVRSIITCGNGCYAFSTSTNKIVIIKYALGVAEQELKEALQVYPNPTSSTINLEFPDSFAITKTTITNTLGQVVMNTDATKDIDVSSLSSGTYFITVATDKGSATKRFIKN